MNREECSPIDTVDELNSLMDDPPKWGRLTVNIEKRSRVVRNQDLVVDGNVCHFETDRPPSPAPRFQYGTQPKTLVCHDMKNGYKDDRFLDGSDDHSNYLFYHWAAVDMFVYFSHHFVTVPPLGWINVAHKHGVQILGTIITEWEDGRRICNRILQSEANMNAAVDSLVSIAKYFKLDGWLLNIENEVDSVLMLLKFVKSLTAKMRAEIKDSVVIWYDSVTINGRLSWQDCLNSQNKNFFDACDGIFLNYCWARRHLMDSVSAAGARKHDVYVGIDVWGRNFWGGGGFNTAEAVKEVHSYNLSMAIFAQAWTHETINFREIRNLLGNSEQAEMYASCSEMDEASSRYKCALRKYFLLRENALWNSLWPYLNTRGPSSLPFHTFFCLGSGENRRYEGDISENETWYNLREQQYQISSPGCSLGYALVKIPRPVSRQTAEKSEGAIKRVQSTHLNSEVSNNEIPVGDERDPSVNEHVDKVEVTEISGSPELSRRAPTQRFYVKTNGETGCSRHYSKDTYFGGNCLKICSPTRDRTGNHTVRLFVCDFQCDSNFIIYLITKPLKDSRDLNLVLTIENNASKSVSSVKLCGESDVSTDECDGSSKPIAVRSKTFVSLRRNLKSEHPGFWQEPYNKVGWSIRYYEVKRPNSTIINVDCEIANGSNTVLLGGIGVVNDVVLF